MLSRYSYSPLLRGYCSMDTWMLSMSSALAPDEYTLERVIRGKIEAVKPSYWWAPTKNIQQFGEADVVLRILNLAANSELDRVKQCEPVRSGLR